MMRLRAGKHQRWPVKPGGISDTTAPASISRACRLRIRAGYAVSAPPASTATGAATAARRRASSAPAWAAESIPSAIPETTGSPAAARPRPSERETSSPYGVARRAPTIATASPAGTAASDPATWSTAGGSGSSRSRSGYARSQRQTAVRPASAIRPRAAAASKRS